MKEGIPWKMDRFIWHPSTLVRYNNAVLSEMTMLRNVHPTVFPVFPFEMNVHAKRFSVGDNNGRFFCRTLAVQKRIHDQEVCYYTNIVIV